MLFAWNTYPQAHRRLMTLPGRTAPILRLSVENVHPVGWFNRSGKDVIPFNAFSTYPLTPEGKCVARTHEAFLPRPDIWPPLQEIFHNEDVGDDTLVVPKGQTANGGKQCASERVSVLQQSHDSWWAITIGVRIRIGPCGGKVQTSTIGNVAAAIRIFNTKRSVVVWTRVVAHVKQRGAKGLKEES